LVRQRNDYAPWTITAILVEFAEAGVPRGFVIATISHAAISRALIGPGQERYRDED
jgi:hypothetical protein